MFPTDSSSNSMVYQDFRAKKIVRMQARQAIKRGYFSTPSRLRAKMPKTEQPSGYFSTNNIKTSVRMQARQAIKRGYFSTPHQDLHARCTHVKHNV